MEIYLLRCLWCFQSRVFCSLSEFFGNFVGIIASLLSKDHDLESIEVSGFFSLVESFHLLIGLGGGPFLVELEGLGSFDEGSSPSASENWQSESGEGKSLQWEDHSWELAHTVDEDSGEVNEINNNDKFAVIFSVIDEANSTWFNEISKTL